MKITLKRKVELKSAITYLKIQVEVPRDDIKNYLESDKFSNPIIESRVRKYLQNIGIYDSQNQLTKEGHKAKETGMVKETEEGKYQIWYSQNDPLFGNRIFYFRRIKPDIRNNLPPDPLELGIDRGKVFVSLPIGGNDEKNRKEQTTFKVVDFPKEYRGENKEGTSIGCTWIWDNMQRSFFGFSGGFKWTEVDEKHKTSSDRIDSINGKREIGLKINFEPYFDNIIPNWNGQTERCGFKLENINDDDVYYHFEYSGASPYPHEGFDSCQYDELPVEPYNTEEALKWRDWLLEKELEKHYIHPDNFSNVVNDINQKNGFAAYADDLDIPGVREYIDQNLEQRKKSDRGAAYWHLVAPFDLNIPQSLRMEEHHDPNKIRTEN
jgi:hypothetical protein